MSMYHVKSDGAMGVCKAQEGHCPFASDAGTKHFTNATEAQAYAEELIRDTTNHNGGMNKMTKTKDEEPTTIPTDDDEPQLTTNKWGLKVTTWPTERGVHSASYLGWRGSGASPHDDHVVSSGGWIDGEYISPSDELGLNRLWERLPEEVKDELTDETYDPVEWNSKILELEKSGELSDEDEKILDAFWIEAEAFEGSVTIYGRDNDVSEMDEDDFRLLGLNRMDSDELWRYGVIVDDDDDDDDDDDEDE